MEKWWLKWLKSTSSDLSDLSVICISVITVNEENCITNFINCREVLHLSVLHVSLMVAWCVKRLWEELMSMWHEFGGLVWHWVLHGNARRWKWQKWLEIKVLYFFPLPFVKFSYLAYFSVYVSIDFPHVVESSLFFFFFPRKMGHGRLQKHTEINSY